jgi:hypothetical protein
MFAKCSIMLTRASQPRDYRYDGAIFLGSLGARAIGERHQQEPSVLARHLRDEAQDETMVHLHGGTVVRFPCSLDEVLAWFA